ncbi:MAG: hypothetical protein AB8B50_21745 [Pirellulaceae bacterium]
MLARSLQTVLRNKLSLGLVLLLLNQSPMHAQNAGGLEIATVEGELTGIAGDRLAVKAEDGKEYFAVYGRKCSLKYSGTADSQFLQPGLMIRFDATFDTAKGVATKPVTELEVYRPWKGRLSQQQRKDQTPGLYPVSKDQQATGNKDNPRYRRNQAQKQTDNKSKLQTFRVVGLINGRQASKLRIMTGRQAILVDLTADPKVTVASGDALFCSLGDKVKVTGLRDPSQETLIKAETIEIKGAKPLGKSGGKQNAKDDGKGKKNDSRSKKRSKPGQ